MMEAALQKPGYDEWKRWIEVTIDRLTTAVHVYNKQPYPDVFIADSERQHKVAYLIDLIRQMHALIESNQSIAKRSEAEIAAADELMIENLLPCIRDALRRLPTTSDDMQRLLKSPWYDNCTGRVANELFRGPAGVENEGIGSGRPEHGRLPEILTNMMNAETTGDERPARLTPQQELTAKRADPASRHRKASFGSAGRVD